MSRQVHHPRMRLVLQPTRMCFSDAGLGQRGHMRSSLYHWLRFAGEGRTLYTALMVKRVLNASISQGSCQGIFLFSTPSHVIHCPCFACATACAHLPASSSRRTSWTFSLRLWDGVALLQAGVLAPRPRPPLPSWTQPMMSLCLSASA